jgi:hypothetical protein
MLRPIRLTALALSFLVVAGCASSKTAAQAGAPRRSTGNVIGGDELNATGATNVYEAVQRLRPQWLTSARIRRGGSGDELVVYLDSNRYGTLTSLRSLSLGGIQEVRYYGASEATNRFGTGHTGGAIVVSMSKQ